MKSSIEDRKFERVTYSVGEAAQILGVSRGLMYKEVRDGKIKGIKIGRKVMIHRSVLEQILGAQ